MTQDDRNRAPYETCKQPGVRRLRRGAFLVLGLLAACGPADLDGDSETDLDTETDPEGYTTKITSGTRTTGYPSVGYLTSGGVSCTATLIGPRDVLTAAHCIESSSGRFLVGGSNRRWSRAYVHEAYNDSTLDNDLAVVILDSAVSGVKPSPLGTAAVVSGQRIALVGYGYTTFSGGNSAGDKYVGNNSIARVGSTWFSYKGNSNNCSGDSGGPSFIGDAVVGVHSSGEGNAYCSTTGYDVRVDRYVAWIKSKALGAGTGGGCTDTAGFVDAQGYRCSAWVGYDCTTAERWGYTQTQESNLVANCRATCGKCGS